MRNHHLNAKLDSPLPKSSDIAGLLSVSGFEAPVSVWFWVFLKGGWWL